MTDHPDLTPRQCEIVAAVVVTGSIKGSARQVGITESSAHRRLSYACGRCGCGSLVELVYHHHRQIDGAIRAPTALAPTG
jgi:DNA-binding NarL/FixJ family response regulator